MRTAKNFHRLIESYSRDPSNAARADEALRRANELLQPTFSRGTVRSGETTMSTLPFDFARAPGEVVPRAVRPYQRAAIDAIVHALETDRSTLCVMATGTGKTFTASELIRKWPGRVLWLSHREELIEQSSAELARNTGEVIEIEKAEQWAEQRARIVVASIATINREARLRRWAPDYFTLVVSDEAHHCLAPTWRAVVAYFTGAKHLGLTATPDRGDGLALGQEFDSVAYIYDVGDAIRERNLVPIVGKQITVSGMDLSGIGTVAGDLNQGQLDDAMGSDLVLEGVALPTLEMAGERRTIVFTTSVVNAHKIAAIINERKPGAARAIDGGMGKDDRREVVQGFREGRFQFLSSVMVPTEGFDVPPVSCIALGRPTKSRALCAQMVGRGLRPSEGKTDCLVLDFAGNSRHDLAGVVDVLGGSFTEAETELAKEYERKAPDGIRPEVALAMARAELQRRAARKVAYDVRAFDVFNTLHVKLDPEAERAFSTQFGVKPPTEKQVAALVKLGVYKDLDSVPEGLSKRLASRMLDALISRIEKNLASYKQLKALKRYGIDAPQITFSQASSVLDALARNGWRPLPAARVQALLS
jgi:superfamily II DNA or RNA helicase